MAKQTRRRRRRPAPPPINLTPAQATQPDRPVNALAGLEKIAAPLASGAAGVQAGATATPVDAGGRITMSGIPAAAATAMHRIVDPWSSWQPGGGTAAPATTGSGGSDVQKGSASTDTLRGPSLRSVPSSTPGPGEVESYIRSAATARGIDPDTAVKVALAEGGRESFNNPGRQSLVGKGSGSQEQSFGIYQFYFGGGLGNEALKKGVDARDPTQWKASVDYALDHVAKNGWGAFHGAAAVGVGNREGIGKNAKAIGTTPPAPLASTPKGPLATAVSAVGGALRKAGDYVADTFHLPTGAPKGALSPTGGGGTVKFDNNSSFKGAEDKATAALNATASTFGDVRVLAGSSKGGGHSYEKGDSEHDLGRAFDLDITGMTDAQKLGLYSAAKQAGFTSFGFGSTSLHVGYRPGGSFAWSYYGGKPVGKNTSYVSIGSKGFDKNATWAGVKLTDLKNDAIANPGKAMYASLGDTEIMAAGGPKVPGAPVASTEPPQGAINVDAMPLVRPDIQTGKNSYRVINNPDATKALQESLNRTTGSKLKVDGINGPLTQTVLKRYQTNNNLNPDGLAGPLTWHALGGDMQMPVLPSQQGIVPPNQPPPGAPPPLSGGRVPSLGVPAPVPGLSGGVPPSLGVPPRPSLAAIPTTPPLSGGTPPFLGTPRTPMGPAPGLSGGQPPFLGTPPTPGPAPTPTGAPPPLSGGAPPFLGTPPTPMGPAPGLSGGAPPFLPTPLQQGVRPSNQPTPPTPPTPLPPMRPAPPGSPAVGATRGGGPAPGVVPTNATIDALRRALTTQSRPSGAPMQPGAPFQPPYNPLAGAPPGGPVSPPSPVPPVASARPPGPPVPSIVQPPGAPPPNPALAGRPVTPGGPFPASGPPQINPALAAILSGGNRTGLPPPAPSLSSLPRGIDLSGMTGGRPGFSNVQPGRSNITNPELPGGNYQRSVNDLLSGPRQNASTPSPGLPGSTSPSLQNIPGLSTRSPSTQIPSVGLTAGAGQNRPSLTSVTPSSGQNQGLASTTSTTGGRTPTNVSVTGTARPSIQNTGGLATGTSRAPQTTGGRTPTNVSIQGGATTSVRPSITVTQRTPTGSTRTSVVQQGSGVSGDQLREQAYRTDAAGRVLGGV